MHKPRTVRNKYVSNDAGEKEKAQSDQDNSQKENTWDIALNVRATKNTFTQVRIQDDIVKNFKQYCLDNDLQSYSGLMNDVLRKFMENNIL